MTVLGFNKPPQAALFLPPTADFFTADGRFFAVVAVVAMQRMALGRW